MQKASKIARFAMMNLYMLSKINWFKFIKNYSKKSDNVVWLNPGYPKVLYRYVTSGILENDLALIKALLVEDRTFRILFGQDTIYKVENKTIYYNLSYNFLDRKKGNPTQYIIEKLTLLESNNNQVIPAISNVEYWENKTFMQKRFVELDIPHPKTYIIESEKDIPSAADMMFPILYKPVHSSSSEGIVEFMNYVDLKTFIDQEQHNGFVLQERLNMSRDLRVTFVGDELVLYYWRINNSKIWRPTSTSHGSTVDFDFYPEQWRTFIYEQYKKLNLNAGAFDVVWQNDDVTTKPLFLEVSPSFMPNPKPPVAYKDIPYSAYKNIVWSREAYFKKYIDIIFDIKLKLIKTYHSQTDTYTFKK